MDERSPRLDAEAVPLSKIHIPQLDGLRGIAVLAVMAHHLGTEVNFALPGHPSAVGWAGVDLFFVLSGFLITGILLDSVSDDAYYRKFYTRRVLRIWPLYFACLFAVYVVFPHLRAVSRAELAEFPWWGYVLFLQNLVFANPSGFPLLRPAWSLAIEEQFYVVWPLLIRLTRARFLPWIVGAIVVGSPLLRSWALAHGTQPYAIYVNTLMRLDGLAVGAIFALLFRTRESAGVVHIARALIVIGTLGTAVMVATGKMTVSGPHANVSPLTFSVLALLFGGMVGYSAVTRTESSAWGTVLRWSFLRYTGKISYALYLLHVVVNTAFGSARVHGLLPKFANGAGDDLFLVVACTGVAYLTASASWYLFESPILNLRTRLESPLQGFAKAVAVGASPE